MSKSPQQSNIVITKLAAARRQLDAAIRMTFANEDELAIHTVAAAAYRVLKDILEKRGRNDREDVIRAGIYGFALALINGNLSESQKEFLKEPHAQRVVSAVAQAIRDHGDQVTPDNIPFSLSAQDKQSHWRSMSKAAAFLKHADRDADTSLPLSEVKNDVLLMHACSAYTSITHAATPEMLAYGRYCLSTNAPEAVDAVDAEVAALLKRLSPSRRRRACAQYMRKLKKEMGLA
jgi:hypothetical protein